MIMSYWFEGNNITFVQLLSQLPYAATCREIIADDLQSDEERNEELMNKAQTYLNPSFDFFESFANEAIDIWEIVSSPFQQESKEEINAFIADDNEEIGDDAAMYQAFNITSARNDQVDNERAASYYEARMKEGMKEFDEDEYGEIDNSDLIFEDDSAGDEDEFEFYKSSSDDSRPKPTNAQRKRQNVKGTNDIAGKRWLSPSKYRRNASNSSPGFEEKKDTFDNSGSKCSTSGSQRNRFVVEDDEIEFINDGSPPFPVHATSLDRASGALRKRVVVYESEDD
jgi:hypothetical protein